MREREENLQTVSGEVSESKGPRVLQSQESFVADSLAIDAEMEEFTGFEDNEIESEPIQLEKPRKKSFFRSLSREQKKKKAMKKKMSLHLKDVNVC